MVGPEIRPVVTVPEIRRVFRPGARTLIGGGGGGRCIFICIHSGYARLNSFEINFITKETSRAEPEYMNIHPPPPISVLAPALQVLCVEEVTKISIDLETSSRGKFDSNLVHRQEILFPYI